MRIAFRHFACLGVVIAIAVGLFAAAADGNAGRAESHARHAACPQVDFAPNSDDIAFNIRTVGVTCATGRTVVAGAASDKLRPGPNRSYRTGAFSCRGKFVKPVGKWYEHYVCRSTRARVVFDRG